MMNTNIFVVDADVPVGGSVETEDVRCRLELTPVFGCSMATVKRRLRNALTNLYPKLGRNTASWNLFSRERLSEGFF